MEAHFIGVNSKKENPPGTMPERDWKVSMQVG
jgi:hypothetical protein